MKPTLARVLWSIAAFAIIGVVGCRAIRRFGDTRQSIDARRLSGQGFQAMHDGHWDTAESLFSEALAVSKADDRAHWGLAETFWNRGEQSLAIQHMEEAVRLSAGDPKFVQRLGRMYLDVGRLPEADQHSRWALQSRRDFADAWALRGDCLRASDEPIDALAAYHRALALQPDYPEVQLQAAEIYRTRQKYGRLLATLDRLQDNVGAEAAVPRVDMLQGIAMRKLGRAEEARRCFLRAAKKDESDPEPHIQLASLALERGDVTLARRSLEVAQQLDPDSLREHTWVAQLLDSDLRLADGSESLIENPQHR